jgi:hypothetical protein
MTSPIPKRVVSVSLGSTKRDKTVTATFFGQPFEISRVGTDGDQERFKRTLAELDGKVDAIGFGGMDQYSGRRANATSSGRQRRCWLPPKRHRSWMAAVSKTRWSAKTVHWLQKQTGIVDFAHSKTLMVAGVDRFGMSEALAAQGGEIIFGDLMFAPRLPFAIRGRKAHRAWARLLLPLVVQMPLSLLYPMGEKQNTITPKWQKYYQWADIIAGDFLYIRRCMPTVESGFLSGKIILTNTTTETDEEELRKRGVKLLITTTPNFDGRSFGTNVMESVLVALNDGKPLTPEEYLETLKKLDWSPNVRSLQDRK